MLDSRLLVLTQVLVGILDALEVCHVDIDFLCIGKVLVYVIEVRKHHVPPMDEFVKGFSIGVDGLVALVKCQEQAYAVTCFASIEFLEKLVH